MMSSTLSDGEAESPGSSDGSVATEVEKVVLQHPWLETSTRLGWYAKGMVYLLMGAVAVAFVWHPRIDEQASPEGALGLVASQPGGRLLLAVFGAGLVLYATWRVLSVAVIRGTSAKDHLQRVGYSFSAIFYGFLALTALSGAFRGAKPDDSYTVERVSRSMMSQSWGRGLLLVAGATIIGVGVYFVRKSLTREYVDHLHGVQPSRKANYGSARVVFVAGMVGWFGRGVVTAMVGFLVVRAAWRFDPSDASGFDRALRRVSEADYGPPVLLVAALGLITYGIYCLLSAPRREIAETPS